MIDNGEGKVGAKSFQVIFDGGESLFDGVQIRGIGGEENKLAV